VANTPHTEFAKLVDEYLNGDRRRFHEHIRDCAHCQLLVRALSGLRRDVWDIAEGRRP
jgi:hypothetical protein